MKHVVKLDYGPQDTPFPAMWIMYAGKNGAEAGRVANELRERGFSPIIMDEEDFRKQYGAVPEQSGYWVHVKNQNGESALIGTNKTKTSILNRICGWDDVNKKLVKAHWFDKGPWRVSDNMLYF